MAFTASDIQICVYDLLAWMIIEGARASIEPALYAAQVVTAEASSAALSPAGSPWHQTRQRGYHEIPRGSGP
jgi:hypothetical protein